MILYHGSTELVDKPEIRVGAVYLDFGVGFYTTTSKEQAERWARIKMRRNNTNQGFVSVYEFDLDQAKLDLVMKEFKTADETWLRFIVGNRRGDTMDAVSGVHIGPVADDNVYQSIRLFETGVYDAEYIVKRLKTEVLQDQWTLHTEKALKYLKFKEYIEIL